MYYGIAMFPTDYSIKPSDLAIAAEERGFESLWFPEHSHIPVARTSPWPGGSELPKMYYDCLDPFVALASCAAVTESIKLATGICLVIQRDPIQTAKDVASLDMVTEGRVLFGIGGGWNAEEIANHGTPFEGRFKLMRERVEAMKQIWTENKAEYHGDRVNFDPIYAWPKPIQKPYPPIHVGGAFPGAARRAIAYGDGWLPLLGRDSVQMSELLPKFRAMAKEAGRDPGAIEVSMFAAPDEADVLRDLRDAGASRAIFMLPPEPLEKILPLLDKFQSLASSVG